MMMPIEAGNKYIWDKKRFVRCFEIRMILVFREHVFIATHIRTVF